MALIDFLENFIQAMPSDALNPMCWRISAKKLYDAYLAHCQTYGLQPVDKQLFVDTILKKYPQARLSPWRFFSRNQDREFDGIMLVKAFTQSKNLMAQRVDRFSFEKDL